MGEGPSSRALVRRILRISRSQPALGLRLAALCGVVLGPRLGDSWWPSAADLEELLGPLERRSLARLSRRIAASELRNRVIMSLLRHDGPAWLTRAIRVRGSEAFQRLADEKTPILVVFWHMGVIRAVETALTAMGCPIIATGDRPPRGPDPGYRWRAVTDPASGTLFLMDALRELRRGVVPVLALDGAGGDSRRVPFLGRSVPAPAGAAMLARRGGARIVPVTTRWMGLSPRVEVTLHEPIPEPPRSGAAHAAWEEEMLTRTLGFFERYQRSHPEDLRIPSIGYVLAHLRAHDRAPGDDDFARLAEEFASEGQ